MTSRFLFFQKKKTQKKKQSGGFDNDFTSFSSEDEQGYLTDIELPDRLLDSLSPPFRCQLGPPSPKHNRFCGEDKITEDEQKVNRIYKALEHGFLKKKEEFKPEIPKEKAKKNLISPQQRPSTSKQHFDEDMAIYNLPIFIQEESRAHLKENESSTDCEDYEEERVLRTLGLNKEIDPTLTFDGCSGATIRRIKKHYNLPNRSGATSKQLLLDGLNDFFVDDSVDFVKTTMDFLSHIKDPKLPLGQTPSFLSNHLSPNPSEPSPTSKKRKTEKVKELPKKKLLKKDMKKKEYNYIISSFLQPTKI